MLKRILTTILIFTLGGFVIAKYFVNKKDINNFNKVFSERVFIKSKIDNIYLEDIVELTNKERISIGLNPLSVNTLLNNSADTKAEDMIALQYFEHISPNGKGVSELGQEAGYEYVTMGENLALGTFTNAKDIVDAWMNSPGHKANILNTKYQEIGVSVKRASYQGNDVWFAVQHFGTSRDVCPKIDQYLKNTIDEINKDLKIKEGEIAILKSKLQAPGAQLEGGYQNQILDFNKKVDEYNKELNSSKEKIDFYNNQVKTFNKCIATFQ